MQSGRPFAVRGVDVLPIRGRPEPVRILELMLPLHYAGLDWLDDFSRGYALFRAGLRPQADRIFQRLAEEASDPVRGKLLERCTRPRRRHGG